MEKSGRILSVDYGEKRVGLAWCDELRVVVTPLKALHNDANLLENIQKIIAENGIKEVLIGIPRRMDGEEGQLAQKVRDFGKQLKELIPDLVITYWDESYTSKEAEKIFYKKFGRHAIKLEDKYLIDSYSAAILLDEYLKSYEDF